MQTQSQSPLVSVMMAVHDGQPFVRQAVESLLRQSLRDFELVIADDGSSDGTLAVLEQLAARDARIRLLPGPHRGVVQARTRALEAARGRFLAVNDADDVSQRQRLLRQVRYLAANPDCLAVGGQLLMIDPEGEPVGPLRCPLSHPQIDANHLRGSAVGIGHSAAMMRADAVREAGGYREAFLGAEDADLWLRLAERGRLANLPQLVVRYRLHERSMSYAQRGLQRRAGDAVIADAWRRRGLPGEAPRRRHRSGWPFVLRPRSQWARVAWQAGNPAGARHLALKALRCEAWSAEPLQVFVESLLAPGLWRRAAARRPAPRAKLLPWTIRNPSLG